MLNRKTLLLLVALLLLVLLPVSIFLIQRQQDIRSRAQSEAVSCLVYAVQDQGLEDSQIFTIDPDTKAVVALGPEHEDHDLEGLDIDPSSRLLYASASNNAGDLNGKIFVVDGESGVLHEVGDTGFKNLEAISFTRDGQMWIWSEDKGLLKVDKQSANAELVFSNDEKIEAIAWNNAGTRMYAAGENELYEYNPSDGSFNRIAGNLPAETEGLEMRPDGLLMIGYHDAEKLIILAYDLTKKETVASESIGGPYDDVEGIAWPDDCDNPPPPVGPTPTPTPQPTSTPPPTSTPQPTNTPEPTATPTASPSPQPSVTPTEGPSPTPSICPLPEAAVNVRIVCPRCQ